MQRCPSVSLNLHTTDVDRRKELHPYEILTHGAKNLPCKTFAALLVCVKNLEETA